MKMNIEGYTIYNGLVHGKNTVAVSKKGEKIGETVMPKYRGGYRAVKAVEVAEDIIARHRAAQHIKLI